MKTDFVIKFQPKSKTVSLSFINFYDEERKDVKNWQTFFLKEEFLDTVDWSKVANSMQLFQHTDVQRYLHNPNGYATLDHKSLKGNYFLDGQLYTSKEEFDKAVEATLNKELSK